jgi:membrane protease YdiL (CAAX protease family)
VALSERDARDARKEWLKLAGVTVLWFLLTKYLVPLGNEIVPNTWKALISFQTFRMICQAVTLAVGVGLCFALLKRPAEALGFARPKGTHVAAATLLAPGAFVVTTYIALQIALPTLLAELATRGPGASRQNAGELGRTLTQAPLLVVILWGAVLAAVGEELLFRGALWSSIERLARLIGQRLRPSPPAIDPAPGEPHGGEGPASEAIPPFMQPSPFSTFARGAIPGVLATLVSAIVFGQMHADMQGGVGVVRVASTTILGLVCGMGRHVTGTIWVPILLHVCNNTLTIASSRKWFTSSGEPLLEGLPNMLVALAIVGLVAAFALFLVSLRVRARRSAAALGEDGALSEEPPR